MKPRPNHALLVLVFDRFRREMLWIGGVGRNGATAAKSPATGAELGPGLCRSISSGYSRPISRWMSGVHCGHWKFPTLIGLPKFTGEQISRGSRDLHRNVPRRLFLFQGWRRFRIVDFEANVSTAAIPAAKRHRKLQGNLKCHGSGAAIWRCARVSQMLPAGLTKLTRG